MYSTRDFRRLWFTGWSTSNTPFILRASFAWTGTLWIVFHGPEWKKKVMFSMIAQICRRSHHEQILDPDVKKHKDNDYIAQHGWSQHHKTTSPNTTIASGKEVRRIRMGWFSIQCIARWLSDRMNTPQNSSILYTILFIRTPQTSWRVLAQQQDIINWKILLSFCSIQSKFHPLAANVAVRITFPRARKRSSLTKR